MDYAHSALLSKEINNPKVPSRALFKAIVPQAQTYDPEGASTC
jgi:hypothetical protein